MIIIMGCDLFKPIKSNLYQLVIFQTFHQITLYQLLVYHCVSSFAALLQLAYFATHQHSFYSSLKLLIELLTLFIESFIMISLYFI